MFTIIWKIRKELAGDTDVCPFHNKKPLHPFPWSQGKERLSYLAYPNTALPYHTSPLENRAAVHSGSKPLLRLCAQYKHKYSMSLGLPVLSQGRVQSSVTPVLLLKYYSNQHSLNNLNNYLNYYLLFLGNRSYPPKGNWKMGVGNVLVVTMTRGTTSISGRSGLPNVLQCLGQSCTRRAALPERQMILPQRSTF